MSAPIVPQRPARSQNPPTASSSLETPKIPPRPARRVEKSHSPSREDRTRSPLNDSGFSAGISTSDRRPYLTDEDRHPSIDAMPLVGQEGMEYASLSDPTETIQTSSSAESPQATRNVAGDLPLHAPRAAASSAAARSQVAPITRTDSSKAASIGIGKAYTEYENVDASSHPTSSRAKEYRPASSLSQEISRSTSRRESLHGEEQELGIPEIGVQVPMYPNAGDVQAPSPGQFTQPQSTGIGFFNTDTPKSGAREGRRKSAQFQVPPGSYGLHGHGMGPQDQFEKQWYEKHPEELSKEEQGAYGPSLAALRSESAMSSDELNQLVHSSSGHNNLGTASDSPSAPPEQLGYELGEEYSSKKNSPQLHPVRSRPDSRSFADSPLRYTSYPDDEDTQHLDVDDSVRLSRQSTGTNKPGRAGYDTSIENREDHVMTPILADDEVSKHPQRDWFEPAVSPGEEKLNDDDYFYPSTGDFPPPHHSFGHSRSASGRRSTSRPSSARLHPYDMENSGTLLDEIDEYEPLFDEEEKPKEKPVTAADKLKRPELERQRFPSQDIWEDSPTSLQLLTTVEGPQEPEEKAAAAARKSARAFETPEQEQARKAEITEQERVSFIQDKNNGFAKPKFNPAVQGELQRPGLQHRFPSQDIWEDTPDSLRLETIIDSSQPTITSPTGGRVPASNNVAQGMTTADKSMGAAPAKPTVPARPSRAKAPETTQEEQSSTAAKEESTFDDSTATITAEKKAPTVPERPKPQVPRRPARGSQNEKATELALEKKTSASSAEMTSPTSPTDKPVPPSTASKPKPAVPSKPSGSSKIANLKAGFMNDLNSRLQLGRQPQKPQEEERSVEPAKEEEKGPLLDARKGRARGPARRKPVEKTPSPQPPTTTATNEATATAPATSFTSCKIISPWSIWSISPSSDVNQISVNITINSSTETAADIAGENPPAPVPEADPETSPLTRNTAGESLSEKTEPSEAATGALASKVSEQRDERAAREEEKEKEILREVIEEQTGAEGDMPNVIPSSS